MNSLAYNIFTFYLLIVLALLMPAIGAWGYRRFLRRLREGQANARLEAYLWTIGLQWTITLGFLAWWLLSGGKLAPLGLVPKAAGLQWLVIAAGVAALVLILIQMVTVLRSPEKLDQVRRQTGELGGIAPQSPTEKRVFVVLAITAGICEEILYRGLLITVLAVTIGTWPAVFLSTVIFGLGHAYQGWTGVGKTAAAGLVMALLAVGSGSLLIPMLLHAVVDLTSGHMLSVASHDVSPGYSA